MPKPNPVRCPYCVEGDHFKVMVKGSISYKCAHCGHVSMPDNPLFKCPCLRCRELDAPPASNALLGAQRLLDSPSFPAYYPSQLLVQPVLPMGGSGKHQCNRLRKFTVVPSSSAVD